MKQKSLNKKLLVKKFTYYFILLLSSLTVITVNANDAIEPQSPDKIKLQLGTYFVADTNTEVSVSSTIGKIGTVIEMERDLGTKDNLSVPRVDGYYRFNDNHRIDFSWFSVDREGSKVISLDFTYNDELFQASETVVSKVQTDFYKVAYGYSFYRTPKVELSFTAGLNILTYNIELNNLTNGNNEKSEFTAPLPIFGLRMDYNINPKWKIHYRVETFYIDINDTFRGSLLDAEIGTEYRITKHFALGMGITRFAVDAKIKSSKYTGGLNDLYRGINLFGVAYF
jgi:hypothetical protein